MSFTLKMLNRFHPRPTHYNSFFDEKLRLQQTPFNLNFLYRGEITFRPLRTENYVEGEGFSLLYLRVEVTDLLSNNSRNFVQPPSSLCNILIRNTNKNFP